MMKSKSNNEVIIRVRDTFKESISSRDSIALLFNRRFEPSQIIIIDFKDVTFISRSATHQLLKEIERIEDRFNCVVKLINTENHINSILALVRESKTHKKQKEEVQQVYFSTSKELKHFLLQF